MKEMNDDHSRDLSPSSSDNAASPSSSDKSASDVGSASGSIREDDPFVAWLEEGSRSEAKSDVGVVLAEFSEEIPNVPPHPPRPYTRARRRLLPLMLFLVTCVSTAFAGACLWVPFVYVPNALAAENMMPIRRVLVSHWDDGLIFMVCLIAILLTHEMGHFLATVRYRVPASFPFFLPLPVLSPIGTLGAVIAMDGSRANRREIFDIGLAGPLAGLAVALPILWIGTMKLDFTQPPHGLFSLDSPLLVTWIASAVHPEGYVAGQDIWQSQLNPYFMAGWIGLFVTAFNMLPVSQFDGGHVIYTLLGRRAYWVVRGLLVFTVVFLVSVNPEFLCILLLFILLLGIDHPPTRDDRVPLGWFRVFLGVCSLSIPVLCFAPRVFIPHMPIASP